MGSCFRWKKKNSYTVTQVDEYTPQGGKYQVNQDQAAGRGKAKTLTANRAASQWAAESRDDSNKRHDVIINQNDVIVKHDDVVLDSTQNEAIKENGFHVEVLKVPTPEPSPPSTPNENRTSSNQVAIGTSLSEHSSIEYQRRDSDHESVQIGNVLAIDEVHVGDHKLEPDVAIDLRRDVSVDLSVNTQEVVVQSLDSSSDDSDDDRENPVQAREEYFAKKASEEAIEEASDYHDDYTHVSTVVTETTTQELVTDAQIHPDAEFEDDPNILHSREDIHMTDSPAGTWDARLNKDVRAELEEVQRSLDGSKTNSTVSLEARDFQGDHVIQPRDPVIIQRVQFDVPDADEDDETTADVATFDNETHFVDESDNPLQITSYETYQTDHMLQEREEIDNDVNDRLVSIAENEYDFPGEPAQNDGEIVLPEGYAISYEEPSSPQRLSDRLDSKDPY